MKINAIAAIGKQNQLALNNELPWHYPEDLEIFRTKVDSKVVIMGRKTYESMPKSFFKKVTPIIVSQTIDVNHHIAYNLDEAIGIAEDMGENEIWICGGVSLYEEAIERKLINHLYISHIPYTGNADRYFPPFTDLITKIVHEEKIFSEKNDNTFKYKVYALENNNTLLSEDNIRLNGYDYGNPYASPFWKSPGTILLNGLSMGHLIEPAVIRDHTAADISVDAGPVCSSVNIQDAINEITSGLSWMPSKPADPVPGQAWFEGGSGYLMTENGPEEILDYSYLSSPMEELQNIIEEVCEQYEGSIICNSLAYDCQNEIARAINRTDPRSSVSVRVDLEMEAVSRPIYTLGNAAAVDHTFGGANNFLNITISGTFLGQGLGIEQRVLLRR